MEKEEKTKTIEEAFNLVKDAISKGVSKYRIATDTSINETTIGNYANGKTKPSFANAKILLNYFNSFEIMDAGETISIKNDFIDSPKIGTKERFIEYLKSKGIGQTAFEKSAGLSRGTITKKTGFSADSIEKIAIACPDLNINWLVTGTGNITNEDKSVSITDSPTSNKDIKILDIRVCAGHGIGFDGDENKVIGYVNIPEFTGCYGITVYGDSMYDMYMSGDTIFVREIKDKTLIDNGQPYVVITQEDRLLKMVYIESGGLKLVSFNPICNPDGRRKYPDMEIEGSRILHLYKVVGKLARTQM